MLGRDNPLRIGQARRIFAGGEGRIVNRETVALEIPASLYAELKELASASKQDPVAIIAEWVDETRQRRQWRQGWAELRGQVQEDGKFQPDETADAIVALTRRSREEIFEAEYAHLYR